MIKDKDGKIPNYVIVGPYLVHQPSDQKVRMKEVNVANVRLAYKELKARIQNDDSQAV